MQNPLECDPHEDYLDAVFARIDRIRTMDASILTERYGVDPAALSPAAAGAKSSWPVERVLADADAQREELRDHLDILVRECVSEGIAYDDAVRQAQQALGDPTLLAVQLSRASAQSALNLNERWLPFLRRDRMIAALSILVPYIALAAPTHATSILAASSCVCIGCGVISGYAYGISMSPELRVEIGHDITNIKEILTLPTLKRITSKMRLARLALRQTCAYLEYAHFASAGIGSSRRERTRQLRFEVTVLIFALSGPCVLYCEHVNLEHPIRYIWAGAALPMCLYYFARNSTKRFVEQRRTMMGQRLA